MPRPLRAIRRVLALVTATTPVFAGASLGLVPTAVGEPPRAPTTATTTVALPTTTTTSTATTTTTTAPPPTTTTAPPAPGLAPYGHATAYGCAAALAYLQAYAAPGYELSCPGYALGHEGMTCFNEAPCGSDQRLVAVADPCPAAYMNEAHNSWVLDNEVLGTPIPDGNPAIDPYGHC